MAGTVHTSRRLALPAVAVGGPPGDGVADAEVAETGVSGLVLTRTDPGSPWRLVHQATGLLVSRSAVSEDSRALMRLAQQLAGMANWSARELTLPGPALRQAVEKAAERCGLTLGSVAAANVEAVTGPNPVSPGAPGSPDADVLLLTRVLRLLHGAVPPGVFASAIAGLDAPERARLRQLLLGDAVASSVVKPISQVKPPPPLPARRPSAASGSTPNPGSATG